MRSWLFFLAGVVCSILAQPNEWIASGWGFLEPVGLFFLFKFLNSCRSWEAALAAFIWAIGLAGVANSWLFSFHPYAFILVALFFTLEFVALFQVLRWALRWNGPWIAPSVASVWTLFEFARTQGFFAFPYDSVASAFWQYPVLFQSADLVGTYGLTFLVVWSAAWSSRLTRVQSRSRAAWFEALPLVVLWGANLGYGVATFLVPDSGPVWRPALVQHVQDPWSGGQSAYSSGLAKLEDLSSKAVASHPDALIWSETAFVPSVEYHNRYRQNTESLALVRDLESFLARTGIPTLLGNGHRERDADGKIQDFNSVLSWNGRWTGRYDKNRLVPFTESFPFRDLLPGVYNWLLEADTHFWVPGHGYPVLRVGSVLAGTPICFEDSFPDAAREFSRAGAQVLVNVTDDAWSKGSASRIQHLALSVFRSVETRLPLVRATNDGATVSVSARGQVVAQLPLGIPGTLVADVRLSNRGLTFYTQWGDWWIAVCVLIFGVSLIGGLRFRS